MYFKRKFLATSTPYETFKYLFYNRSRFYASICGSDVTNPDYRYTLMTYIFVTSTFLFTILSLYSMYAFEDNRDKVKCLITFPIGILVSLGFILKLKNLINSKKKFQGIIKQSGFLRNPMRTVKNIASLERIYVQNEQNLKNKKILNNTMQIAKFVVTLMEVIYGLTSIVYLFNPIWMYFHNGEKELILYVFFPGTNAKGKIGFFVNILYQLMMLIFGEVGTCSSDFICFCIVVHLRPLQQIFRAHILDLNDMLLISPSSDTIQIKRQFRNIVLMHKEIYRFFINI